MSLLNGRSLFYYKLIPVTFYKDPKGFGGYVALILSHYFMF